MYFDPAHLFLSASLLRLLLLEKVSPDNVQAYGRAMQQTKMENRVKSLLPSLSANSRGETAQ